MHEVQPSKKSASRTFLTNPAVDDSNNPALDSLRMVFSEQILATSRARGLYHWQPIYPQNVSIS